MATKNTNSTAVKKVNYSAKYGKSIDKKIRNFSEYLREVVADFNAIVLNPNTKESADYLSKADAERIAFAKEVFNSAAFSVDNLTLGYIKKWYPYVNAANQICDCKKVAAEEEAEYKKQAEEIAKAASSKEEAAEIVAKCGLQFAYNKDNVLLRLIPVDVWTGSKVLAKIKAAKKAEEAAKKAEAAIESEVKKAAKEAATIEALKLRLAELEAKQAARSSSDNCNKASKKQQQKAA